MNALTTVAAHLSALTVRAMQPLRATTYRAASRLTLSLDDHTTATLRDNICGLLGSGDPGFPVELLTTAAAHLAATVAACWLDRLASERASTRAS